MDRTLLTHQDTYLLSYSGHLLTYLTYLLRTLNYLLTYLFTYLLIHRKLATQQKLYSYIQLSRL